MRSVVQLNVKVLAMTATATRQLRLKVSEIIGLLEPVIIAVSPCKENLVYAVSTFTSIAVTFTPVLERLRKGLIAAPRMIIYCKKGGAELAH